jgi:dienelactone hydrolase
VLPVERIHGPLLWVCGGADQVWNSCASGQAAMSRLDRSPYPHQLLDYPDAGHLVDTLVPYWPTNPPAQANLEGSTPEANDLARAQAWPLVLRALAELR